MRRTSALHVRNERTWDRQALASPALVSPACASLVHASVPPLPQRLAAAWGWGSAWSRAGHCTTVKVFWPGETGAAGLSAGESGPED